MLAMLTVEDRSASMPFALVALNIPPPALGKDDLPKYPFFVVVAKVIPFNIPPPPPPPLPKPTTPITLSEETSARDPPPLGLVAFVVATLMDDFVYDLGIATAATSAFATAPFLISL